MMDIPNKALFRLDEVAEWLCVSISTVRRYIEEDHLDSITLPGGHRRITRESILKLVEQTRSNAVKSP